ncbi:SmdB family multidrug efflux ABC transporter permease/ATP-binding protein [Escherichia coli]|nr:SmdB family multidrug efflux ABC transporter permease/ATP-binding protein [Escherichia coli]MEB6723506.1 SmdB family multidrug efflux ABC transporter permease/ATP-binding protein [Escherichia coli]
MRLFAQLSWYFRREWRRYLGAVALLVIIAMLQLVPPKVVGIVVDGVTEQHFTTGQILMWIATMVLIAVVVYLLRYVWRVLLFGASYQLAVELREDYYRQLSRQHPEFYQRYSTPIVRRVRAYLADINDGFNEIINGMSVIQQFRQQARFGERMGEASRSHYMARMQTLRLDGFLLRPLLSLFSSLILCGLLMLFGFSASGTIEVGVLYAFISYLGRLNEPLIELTTQQAMLQQAVVAGERVFELMDGPRQQYGNDERPLQSGTIEVDNVSFAYRDDNLVLKNINLSVPSRNFVALVGHTGSGKSTLASLLMGYYPLTEGEIRLDGRPLSSLSHSALRQGVAMVQQDPVVLADTFLANVTLGRDISEERVWQALETVQLAELARSMSDGIYTPLGEQGNNLSVGQKQLLALARVLVETPQILILDEATASIDSGTEQAIQHALAAVREHTTLVVIAHRLSTIVDADTILVLHRGQAVEQGTHQQLLAAQGRYWQMYQLQLAGEELAASVREEESLSA